VLRGRTTWSSDLTVLLTYVVLPSRRQAVRRRRYDPRWPDLGGGGARLRPVRGRVRGRQPAAT
jgi:hypothetical protein